MRKIAVIFESSPFDRKGLFNAVHNRILHLVNTGECSVDAYCIHSWDNAFTRKVRHTPEITTRCDELDVDGISYRMLWYDFSITDHILVTKLHRPPFFFARFVKKCLDALNGYDMIIAHSFTGGVFAYEASKRYGIPYFVNWHGSDIHTHPWSNELTLRWTEKIMSCASANFFVSSALKEASDRIVKDTPKYILYNGVSDKFMALSDEKVFAMKTGYGVNPDVRIVAFVGSIVEVKNVRVLHSIFSSIRSLYPGPIQFWMVGDGKLRAEIEAAMAKDTCLDVRFWGNVPADDMPSVMNCIDLMVLPSLNEGLPLVCAEAIRCGANVVGSRVGGISEVIGLENTVPLGDGFVEGISTLAVQKLLQPQRQSLPPELDWALSAAKELSAIKKVL